MNTEKRETQRIDTAFFVKCMPLPEEKEKKCFFTVIKDLSSGGIQILTENSLPLGKNLKIDINLIHENAQACAQVVWQYKEPEAERYCVGLKFLDICDNSKRKLGEVINTICFYEE
ncbi:MAG: PilZ domain-containing protein [Spirochaetes bacterium]|nr:PilZ domain-containing protein [Spirochaetota bacterium]